MSKITKLLIIPLANFLLFACIAVLSWRLSGITFYLVNFGYIGISGSIGFILFFSLPKKYSGLGRRVTQIMIGFYILIILGIGNHENMQIEGFFQYLFLGIFAGSTLHYLIAKISGPFIYGRSWCGWACWTAMILDFLPWKKPKQSRIKNIGFVRYVHFVISLSIVIFAWFYYRIDNIESVNAVSLVWLAVGNSIYYIVSIILAFILKDNRAFCKYLCPIPTIQKIGARFAILKIKINSDKCTKCGACEKICPMNIKLLDYMKEGKRILSTECIMCAECVNVCPVSATCFSTGFDVSTEEKIEFAKLTDKQMKDVYRSID